MRDDGKDKGIFGDQGGGGGFLDFFFFGEVKADSKGVFEIRRMIFESEPD